MRIILILVALMQTSFAIDIISNDPAASEYVHIVEYDENLYAFNICNAQRCQPLGKKAFYSKNDIRIIANRVVKSKISKSVLTITLTTASTLIAGYASMSTLGINGLAALFMGYTGKGVALIAATAGITISPLLIASIFSKNKNAILSVALYKVLAEEDIIIISASEIRWFIKLLEKQLNYQVESR